MNIKDESAKKGTEQMQFDQGWWDFILSNEPVESNNELVGGDHEKEFAG